MQKYYLLPFADYFSNSFYQAVEVKFRKLFEIKHIGIERVWIIYKYKIFIINIKSTAGIKGESFSLAEGFSFWFEPPSIILNPISLEIFILVARDP